MGIGRIRLSRLAMLAAILALAAVPLLGLAGCGEEDVEEQVNEALERIDEEIEASNNYTVEVTGFTCPVTPDADTGEPSEGSVLATVNVTLKNESDTEQLVSAGNFLLGDEEGREYEANSEYDGANALGTAETIAPGEEISGVILFEVPSYFEPTYLTEFVEGGIHRDLKVELPEPSEG